MISIFDTANIIRIITHAELALDDGRNSCLRANINHKAVGLSATLEQGGKPKMCLISTTPRYPGLERGEGVFISPMDS